MGLGSESLCLLRTAFNANRTSYSQYSFCAALFSSLISLIHDFSLGALEAQSALPLYWRVTSRTGSQAPFLIVLFFSPTATSQVPVDSGGIVAPSTTTTAYYLAHPLASLEAFAGFMQAATSFKASKGRKKERKKKTFFRKASLA